MTKPLSPKSEHLNDVEIVRAAFILLNFIPKTRDVERLQFVSDIHIATIRCFVARYSKKLQKLVPNAYEQLQGYLTE